MEKEKEKGKEKGSPRQPTSAWWHADLIFRYGESTSSQQPARNSQHASIINIIMHGRGVLVRNRL